MSKPADKPQTAAQGLERVLARLKSYWPHVDTRMVQAAYEFAEQAHAGQKRLSGEPFITHPVAVAEILTEIETDPASISAGLLHDVIEDCDVSPADLAERFGRTIALLVDGVTKLTRLDWTGKQQKQADNLRKMFLAMAKDIRVVVIKLADRLHNMRTLDALPEAKRRETAQETIQILAPLAHRLGIWHVKWELEDLALRHLEPKAYEEIARRVSASRAEREALIEAARKELSERLRAAGLEAEVHGRAKHFYSIHQKMRTQHIEFDQVADLNALRVLTHSIPDCYAALGVVHSLWMPIRNMFSDFISKPKTNQYQSLHTKVMTADHQIIEVQIRTHEMHRLAEYGVAAHWRYKEGGGNQELAVFDKKVSWLRQLLEIETETRDEHEFLESLEIDLFKDQVFVFTPENDVIDLPRGATPIDFAYRIHTEIGDHCVGARVNGDRVGLDYQFESGDICEIITSTAGRPNRDWLSLARSSHARQKIRRFLRRQTRAENIQRGRESLEQELKRLGTARRERVNLSQLGDLARKSNLQTEEDLYAAIGFGDLEPETVIARLTSEYHRPATLSEEAQLLLPQQALEKVSEPQVAPVGGPDFQSRLSKCCHPLPGDEIVGYITRGRGLTIHRADCKNVLYHIRREPERALDLTWPEIGDTTFRVQVEVTALDRVGLLSHITAIVAESGINIAAADVQTDQPGVAVLRMSLDIDSRQTLDRIVQRLRGLLDVLRVRKI